LKSHSGAQVEPQTGTIRRDDHPWTARVVRQRTAARSCLGAHSSQLRHRPRYGLLAVAGLLQQGRVWPDESRESPRRDAALNSVSHSHLGSHQRPAPGRARTRSLPVRHASVCEPQPRSSRDSARQHAQEQRGHGAECPQGGLPHLWRSVQSASGEFRLSLLPTLLPGVPAEVQRGSQCALSPFAAA